MIQWFIHDLDILLNKKITFIVKVQPIFTQAYVYKLEVAQTFVAKTKNEYIVNDVFLNSILLSYLINLICVINKKFCSFVLSENNSTK